MSLFFSLLASSCSFRIFPAEWTKPVKNKIKLSSKKRSGGMSNPKIDEWYGLAMENGASGGKLIGAGGGGFLMFYAKDKQKLRHAMGRAGLEEVRFRFEMEGIQVMPP